MVQAMLLCVCEKQWFRRCCFVYVRSNGSGDAAYVYVRSHGSGDTALCM